MQRTLSALVFAPVTLFLLLFHPLVAHVTLTVLALLTLRELKTIFARQGVFISPLAYLAYGLLSLLNIPIITGAEQSKSLFFFSLSLTKPLDLVLFYWALLVLQMILSMGYAAWLYPQVSLATLGTNSFIMLYPMAGLFCAQLSLSYPWWRDAMLLALVLTWTYDSVAFAGGSRWGRHFILPQLSPRKSREGVILGLLGVVSVAFLYYFINPSLFSLPWLLLIALVGGIMAQVGDVVASLMKRYCQVKDSGTFLPGHGGFLDRFDAFYMVIIWVFVVFLIGV
ncbi:MAG: phosphatidate cytidylyltransferase [Symbiobacteriaceae bacterium]|nr:phosphatidate cytidylyltransferase [Symbiobacteriaceae bacterium]